MPAPKDPIKYIEWKKKLSDAHKGEKNHIFGKSHSEETKKKIGDVNRGRIPSIETRKKLSDVKKGKHHSEETKKKIGDANTGVNNPNFGKPLSEETRKKISLSNTGKIISEETRKKISSSNTGKIISEETKKKLSLAKSGENHPMFGKHHSEETRKKISDADRGEKNHYFGKSHSEETRKKISDTHKGKIKSEEHKKKISDGHKTLESIELRVGGFWIGNVTYPQRKQYCEKWNKDLWVRIDEYQEYKSAISGKMREENSNNRALSRHHVYWQEKACCEWDEDAQGYYAMINIGTNCKPNMYKHYIKGDPNKFVLLTCQEHGIISKDKLKWIKYFEDKIEDEWDGKCYYTKEEFEELNNMA